MKHKNHIALKVVKKNKKKRDKKNNEKLKNIMGITFKLFFLNLTRQEVNYFYVYKNCLM